MYKGWKSVIQIYVVRIQKGLNRTKLFPLKCFGKIRLFFILYPYGRFSDLMIFSPTQENYWAIPLITSQFPLIRELLPPDAPAGHRFLRIGQFWSLEHTEGHQEQILEILGGILWVSLMYENGYPWFRGLAAWQLCPTQTSFGFIQRSLESAEERVPHFFSPFIPSEVSFFRSCWALSSHPP